MSSVSSPLFCPQHPASAWQVRAPILLLCYSEQSGSLIRDNRLAFSTLLAYFLSVWYSSQPPAMLSGLLRKYKVTCWGTCLLPKSRSSHHTPPGSSAWTQQALSYPRSCFSWILLPMVNSRLEIQNGKFWK